MLMVTALFFGISSLENLEEEAEKYDSYELTSEVVVIGLKSLVIAQSVSWGFNFVLNSFDWKDEVNEEKFLKIFKS